MKTQLFSSVVFLFLAIPTAAFAHDASMHQGKATMGEVTSMTGDQIAMKTAKGNVNVTMNADTKVELEKGQAGTKGDLKVGKHLMVTGTKLPGGELVAKEVMIHGEDEHKKE